MEKLRIYCAMCAFKQCLQNVYISLGTAILVIVLAVTLSLIQRSDIVNSMHQQTALAVDELDLMVTTMYGSVLNVNQANAQQADHQYAAIDGSAGKMDRIKSHLKLLKAELHRFIATDGTGRADFALENAGAKIVSIGDTKLFWPQQSNLVQKTLSFMGLLDPYTGSNNPRRAIQPSMQPGDCFAFTGVGELVIKLVRDAVIEAVSIEHILPQMSPDGSIANAPKRFAVYGVQHDWNYFYFGTFHYDISREHAIQTFEVERNSVKKYPMVRVRFASNHGHPSHTCVYRVRVHGRAELPATTVTGSGD